MRRYGALVAIPGARVPLVFSTLGSMPIGMFGLGILLLAYDTSGSFAQAGRVAGAFSLANAFGALVQGRLMDRHGQTRVLRIAAAAHLPALIALVVAAQAGASAWVLALFALAGGATFPQLPAAMRSLWNALVDDPEQRATAYALVAVVFEVAVVTAPVLVAGIVAVASPGVAVIVAGALGTFSALAFAMTPVSRRWRGERHEAGWLGPLVAPGMRTVFFVLAVFGDGGRDRAGRGAGVRRRARVGGDRRRAAGRAVGGQPRGWPGVRRAHLARAPAGAHARADADPRRGRSRCSRWPTPSSGWRSCSSRAGCCSRPPPWSARRCWTPWRPPGTVTEAFAAMVMGIVAGTAVGNALGGALVESLLLRRRGARRGRDRRRRVGARPRAAPLRVPTRTRDVKRR